MVHQPLETALTLQLALELLELRIPSSVSLFALSGSAHSLQLRAVETGNSFVSRWTDHSFASEEILVDGLTV